MYPAPEPFIGSFFMPKVEQEVEQEWNKSVPQVEQGASGTPVLTVQVEQEKSLVPPLVPLVPPPKILIYQSLFFLKEQREQREQ